MIAAAYRYHARVLRVIDGDTLDVEVDVGFRLTTRLPLRLARINAPERAEGKRATEALATHLGTLPRDVVVETAQPRDKYGRYLAEVYLPDDDANVSDWMVSQGYAAPYAPS